MQDVVDRVVAGTPGVRWSIRIAGGPGPHLVADHEPGSRLRTASIGKILLLAETARRFEDGTLDPAEPLRRDPALAVADSGLWQHLAVDALPAADVAALIAAVSDNYATNVLLDRIGLESVAALRDSLGLRDTSLNDRVRGFRAPGDTRTLSTGSAAELVGLMGRIARGDLISPAVSGRLDGWLATNVDLSMVAAGFHLDPLAHVEADRGCVLRNKTGTDDGIRADVGYVTGRASPIAYAVLANWPAAEFDARDAVMTGMRTIGSALRRTVDSSSGIQPS